MKMIDALLAELEQEAATTRVVLERIPEEHLSWRPHPKSMSLGQLALHVATVPGNVAEIAAMDVMTSPPSFTQSEAATTAELLPSLTESLVKARRALGGFDDEKMSATWRMQSGGKDIMAMPRVAFARHHAEPLVPPSWPAAGVSAAAQSLRALRLRPDRGRESVCAGLCLSARDGRSRPSSADSPTDYEIDLNVRRTPKAKPSRRPPTFGLTCMPRPGEALAKS